jgi:hypothetical protein
MSSGRSLNARRQSAVVPTPPPIGPKSAAAERRAAKGSLIRRLADENIELARLVRSLRQQFAAAEAENRMLLDEMSLFRPAMVKPDKQ